MQEEGAPAHWPAASEHAKTLLGIKCLNRKEWPAYSPNITPLDFFYLVVADEPGKSVANVWQVAILQIAHMGRRAETLEELRAQIDQAWADLPQEYICHAIDSIPNRMQQCINVQGGPIKRYTNAGL
jgi:hypothetical protein